MSFARRTKVSAAKTQQEIQRVVRTYGATEFAAGFMAGCASVQFAAEGRRVRFSAPLPDPKRLSVAACEAEERRVWRCLLLSIKAKLVAVADKISTFDEEFLSHIVGHDGRTVWEVAQKLAVEGRPLLPPVST